MKVSQPLFVDACGMEFSGKIKVIVAVGSVNISEFKYGRLLFNGLLGYSVNHSYGNAVLVLDVNFPKNMPFKTFKNQLHGLLARSWDDEPKRAVRS